jgi:hypothetical protein
MACPICHEEVKLCRGVEPCCGMDSYHFKCITRCVKIQKSAVVCPKCRAEVPVPVVYGNVLEGNYIYFPLTISKKSSGSLTRTERAALISACDYVLVTFANGAEPWVFDDVALALQLGRPVYTWDPRRDIPRCVRSDVNLKMLYPDRKRRMEAMAKSALLHPGIRGLLDGSAWPDQARG